MKVYLNIGIPTMRDFECETYFAIVTGLSESGVFAQLAGRGCKRTTTIKWGLRGSQIQSQRESRCTGLGESGDLAMCVSHSRPPRPTQLGWSIRSHMTILWRRVTPADDQWR